MNSIDSMCDDTLSITAEFLQNNVQDQVFTAIESYGDISSDEDTMVPRKSSTNLIRLPEKSNCTQHEVPVENSMISEPIGNKDEQKSGRNKSSKTDDFLELSKELASLTPIKPGEHIKPSYEKESKDLEAAVVVSIKKISPTKQSTDEDTKKTYTSWEPGDHIKNQKPWQWRANKCNDPSNKRTIGGLKGVSYTSSTVTDEELIKEGHYILFNSADLNVNSKRSKQSNLTKMPLIYKKPYDRFGASSFAKGLGSPVSKQDAEPARAYLTPLTTSSTTCLVRSTTYKQAMSVSPIHKSSSTTRVTSISSEPSSNPTNNSSSPNPVQSDTVFTRENSPSSNSLFTDKSNIPSTVYIPSGEPGRTSPPGDTLCKDMCDTSVTNSTSIVNQIQTNSRYSTADVSITKLSPSEHQSRGGSNKSAVHKQSGLAGISKTPVSQQAGVASVCKTPVSQQAGVASVCKTPVSQQAGVASVCKTPVSQQAGVASVCKTPVSQQAGVASVCKTPVSQQAGVTSISKTLVSQQAGVASVCKTPVSQHQSILESIMKTLIGQKPSVASVSKTPPNQQQSILERLMKTPISEKVTCASIGKTPINEQPFRASITKTSHSNTPEASSTPNTLRPARIYPANKGGAMREIGQINVDESRTPAALVSQRSNNLSTPPPLVKLKPTTTRPPPPPLVQIRNAVKTPSPSVGNVNNKSPHTANSVQMLLRLNGTTVEIETSSVVQNNREVDVVPRGRAFKDIVKEREEKNQNPPNVRSTSSVGTSGAKSRYTHVTPLSRVQCLESAPNQSTFSVEAVEINLKRAARHKKLGVIKEKLRETIQEKLRRSQPQTELVDLICLDQEEDDFNPVISEVRTLQGREENYPAMLPTPEPRPVIAEAVMTEARSISGRTANYPAMLPTPEAAIAEIRPIHGKAKNHSAVLPPVVASPIISEVRSLQGREVNHTPVLPPVVASPIISEVRSLQGKEVNHSAVLPTAVASPIISEVRSLQGREVNHTPVLPTAVASPIISEVRSLQGREVNHSPVLPPVVASPIISEVRSLQGREVNHSPELPTAVASPIISEVRSLQGKEVNHTPVLPPVVASPIISEVRSLQGREVNHTPVLPPVVASPIISEVRSLQGREVNHSPVLPTVVASSIISKIRSLQRREENHSAVLPIPETVMAQVCPIQGKAENHSALLATPEVAMAKVRPVQERTKNSPAVLPTAMATPFISEVRSIQERPPTERTMPDLAPIQRMSLPKDTIKSSQEVKASWMDLMKRYHKIFSTTSVSADDVKIYLRLLFTFIIKSKELTSFRKSFGIELITDLRGTLLKEKCKYLSPDLVCSTKLDMKEFFTKDFDRHAFTYFEASMGFPIELCIICLEMKKDNLFLKFLNHFVVDHVEAFDEKPKNDYYILIDHNLEKMKRTFRYMKNFGNCLLSFNINKMIEQNKKRGSPQKPEEHKKQKRKKKVEKKTDEGAEITKKRKSVTNDDEIVEDGKRVRKETRKKSKMNKTEEVANNGEKTKATAEAATIPNNSQLDDDCIEIEKDPLDVDVKQEVTENDDRMDELVTRENQIHEIIYNVTASLHKDGHENDEDECSLKIDEDVDMCNVTESNETAAPDVHMDEDDVKAEINANCDNLPKIYPHNISNEANTKINSNVSVEYRNNEYIEIISDTAKRKTTEPSKSNEEIETLTPTPNIKQEDDESNTDSEMSSDEIVEIEREMKMLSKAEKEIKRKEARARHREKKKEIEKRIMDILNTATEEMEREEQRRKEALELARIRKVSKTYLCKKKAMDSDQIPQKTYEKNLTKTLKTYSKKSPVAKVLYSDYVSMIRMMTLEKAKCVSHEVANESDASCVNKIVEQTPTEHDILHNLFEEQPDNMSLHYETDPSLDNKPVVSTDGIDFSNHDNASESQTIPLDVLIAESFRRDFGQTFDCFYSYLGVESSMRDTFCEAHPSLENTPVKVGKILSDFEQLTDESDSDGMDIYKITFSKRTNRYALSSLEDPPSGTRVESISQTKEFVKNKMRTPQVDARSQVVNTVLGEKIKTEVEEVEWSLDEPIVNDVSLENVEHTLDLDRSKPLKLKESNLVQVYKYVCRMSQLKKISVIYAFDDFKEESNEENVKLLELILNQVYRGENLSDATVGKAVFVRASSFLANLIPKRVLSRKRKTRKSITQSGLKRMLAAINMAKEDFHRMKACQVTLENCLCPEFIARKRIRLSIESCSVMMQCQNHRRSKIVATKVLHTAYRDEETTE